MTEDVDLEALEAVTRAEILGDIWPAVETVGFAAFFDGPAKDDALKSPSLVYRVRAT